MTQFPSRRIQVCFGCVCSQQQKWPKMQFWEQHLYNLGSDIAYICFSSLGAHQRRRETSWGGLLLLCIISINVFTSFLSFWGSTQVCWNAPETWQRLPPGCLGEGREGVNGEVSPGFKFQDKNFCMSNSSQFQEPLDNIGNPKIPCLCLEQAEGWDFRRHGAAGCCSCQRAGCAHRGKRSPRLGRLSSRGKRGGKRSRRFCGRQSSGTSLAAGLGRLSPAHSWPQLAAAAWEPPAPAALPSAAPVAGGEPGPGLRWCPGAARTSPRLKSRALIKLMACLACNLSSWVSTSLWSNRFT